MKESPFLPVMLGLTWVLRAFGRLERHRAYGGEISGARAGNRRVAAIELLAEKQDCCRFSAKLEVPAS